MILTAKIFDSNTKEPINEYSIDCVENEQYSDTFHLTHTFRLNHTGTEKVKVSIAAKGYKTRSFVLQNTEDVQELYLTPIGKVVITPENTNKDNSLPSEVLEVDTSDTIEENGHPLSASKIDLIKLDKEIDAILDEEDLSLKDENEYEIIGTEYIVEDTPVAEEVEEDTPQKSKKAKRIPKEKTDYIFLILIGVIVAIAGYFIYKIIEAGNVKPKDIAGAAFGTLSDRAEDAEAEESTIAKSSNNNGLPSKDTEIVPTEVPNEYLEILKEVRQEVREVTNKVTSLSKNSTTNDTEDVPYKVVEDTPVEIEEEKIIEL